jgi:hypothetical protein
MLGFILLLGALSCRFLIRGEPPNKNAANPSPGETLRERETRRWRSLSVRRRAHPQPNLPLLAPTDPYPN